MSHAFSLVSCSAYSSTMKMGAVYSFKRWLIFKGLYGVISQKIELFITTAVRTSYPMCIYLFMICLMTLLVPGTMVSIKKKNVSILCYWHTKMFTLLGLLGVHCWQCMYLLPLLWRTELVHTGGKASKVPGWQEHDYPDRFSWFSSDSPC
jgi:hypothetical protein